MTSLKSKLTTWIKEVFEEKGYHINELIFPDTTTIKGGNSSDMVCVEAKCTKNQKEKLLHLIVKRGKNSDISLNDFNMQAVYKNEMRIYDQLIPRIQKITDEINRAERFQNIPKCYGTFSQNDEYILIMENLKDEGYKLNVLKEPQNIKHVKIVIEAYAKWTALNLILKKRDRDFFEQFSKYSDEVIDSRAMKMLVKTFLNEVDYLIGVYKEKNDFRMVEKVEIIKKKYSEWVGNGFKRNDEDYLIIRHGDSWNNNFLFQYNDDKNPEKVMIVDWQLSLPSSPMADLTQYLFNCCTKVELDCIDEVLEFYYDIFSKKILELEGGDPEEYFPKKDFLDSFKEYVPIAMALMPLSVKASCKNRLDEMERKQSKTDEDFGNIFGKKVVDPERYFDRVNGLMEFAVQRGYL